MEKQIKKIKPKIILHLAAISRPMSVHEKQISKSIDTNIIGTCNLVKVCKKYSIKLVYICHLITSTRVKRKLFGNRSSFTCK